MTTKASNVFCFLQIITTFALNKLRYNDGLNLKSEQPVACLESVQKKHK